MIRDSLSILENTVLSFFLHYYFKWDYTVLRTYKFKNVKLNKMANQSSSLIIHKILNSTIQIYSPHKSNYFFRHDILMTMLNLEGSVSQPACSFSTSADHESKQGVAIMTKFVLPWTSTHLYIWFTQQSCLASPVTRLDLSLLVF